MRKKEHEAPPRVHEQALQQLRVIAESGEPPLEQLPPAEARRVANYRVARNGWGSMPLSSVEEIDIPGPGGALRTRFYRPDPSQELPLILFFHGGGFMVGNLDTHDSLCRILSARVNAAVLAVDYRLAPEHKFPAAQEDCLYTARWAMENSARLRIDVERTAAVGESSGGSLTAVVAQAAARTGAPRLALQVMIYPSLDMGMNFPSYERFGEGYFFTRKKAEYFVKNFLRSEKDAEDIRASPLRASTLGGVAPALIIAAGLDPMVDEAAEYASRLQADGVRVDYQCFEGWPHGFLFWAHTDAAQRAMNMAVDALRRALRSTNALEVEPPVSRAK
jgi:acetyl esterase